MAKKSHTQNSQPATPKEYVRNLIEWMSQGVYEKEQIFAIALIWNESFRLNFQCLKIFSASAKYRGVAKRLLQETVNLPSSDIIGSSLIAPTNICFRSSVD